MSATLGQRFRLIARPAADRHAAFARDVVAGLGASPKRLSCCYFYDADGSRLFEAICELPEYYLTRAEAGILRQHAAEIAAAFPGETTLIELGSGNAAKTRLLIEAFLATRPRQRYVPVDICRTVLEESSLDLLRSYSGLDIVAVAAEYHEGLQQIQAAVRGPRLILWLGSNIGNFERTEAAVFLDRVRRTMTPVDRLLVGIDLRKERAVLEAAYDDAQGVTAEFNLNLLTRINRELHGHFDVAQFRHRAVYNDEVGRIEMYLVSARDQSISIEELKCTVNVAAGEAVHTENSYKYSLQEIDALARTAGLTTERRWLDADERFSLNLLAPASANR
jgi:L-histidine N-alpha-methyltransferase